MMSWRPAALQYSEVVNIFEPATTTSLAPNLTAKDADLLHGVAGFTAQQLEDMGLTAANRRMSAVHGGKRGRADINRRSSNPNFDVYGRVGPRVRAKTPTLAHELDNIREKVEGRLCGRGASSGTQRVNAVFQDHDTCVASGLSASCVSALVWASRWCVTCTVQARVRVPGRRAVPGGAAGDRRGPEHTAERP